MISDGGALRCRRLTTSLRPRPLLGEGSPDRDGAVGPEVVAAVVPFLERRQSASLSATQRSVALLTRSYERRPGTDLLRSADTAARVLADQAGRPAPVQPC